MRTKSYDNNKILLKMNTKMSHILRLSIIIVFVKMFFVCKCDCAFDPNLYRVVLQIKPCAGKNSSPNSPAKRSRASHISTNFDSPFHSRKIQRLFLSELFSCNKPQASQLCSHIQSDGLRHGLVVSQFIIAQCAQIFVNRQDCAYFRR